MLSALLPATYTSCLPRRGSTCRWLRSSTWLSATARRASRWWAALPTSARWVRSVNGCSKSPSSNFAVRIRETASSIRVIDTSPASTSWVSVGMNSSQPLGLFGAWIGSMNMSMPAFTDASTWSA